MEKNPTPIKHSFDPPVTFEKHINWVKIIVILKGILIIFVLGTIFGGQYYWTSNKENSYLSKNLSDSQKFLTKIPEDEILPSLLNPNPTEEITITLQYPIFFIKDSSSTNQLLKARIYAYIVDGEGILDKNLILPMTNYLVDKYKNSHPQYNEFQFDYFNRSEKNDIELYMNNTNNKDLYEIFIHQPQAKYICFLNNSECKIIFYPEGIQGDKIEETIY